MKQKKETWRRTVRVGAVRVYAFERSDRAGIFLKYTSSKRTGRDRRVKTKLAGDFSVRDGQGQLSAKLERQVIKAVERFAASLLVGEEPAVKSDKVRALTIHEGFDLLLDTEVGKFAMRSRRWEEVGRARHKNRADPWTPADLGVARPCRFAQHLA